MESGAERRIGGEGGRRENHDGERRRKWKASGVEEERREAQRERRWRRKTMWSSADRTHKRDATQLRERAPVSTPKQWEPTTLHAQRHGKERARGSKSNKR